MYADPSNQGGPLQLIPAGIAALSDVDTAWGWAVFYLVNISLILAGSAFLLLSVLGPLRRPVAYTVMGSGVVAVLIPFVPDSIAYGHPAQAVIPLLWIGAALCARKDHAVSAAILVAISAGFETWGILGCGLVLAASRRRWPLAAVVGVTIVAALYLPFVVSGHFAMFEYSWPVDRETLIGRLFPDLVTFPWGFRLVQAAIAIAAGAVIAIVTSRIESGLWIAPLVVVIVRIVLDPLLRPYYWIEVGVIFGVVLPLAVARREWAAVALSGAGLVTLQLAYSLATST